MKTKAILGILVLAAVAAGGYFTYEYLKQKPPRFLADIVTKTEPAPPLPAGELAPFTAPEGFTATIYSREVPGARVMTRDDRGTMLVSSTKSGKVYALPDEDGDGQADRTVTVLEGLDEPHGILVDCAHDDGACTLYVAETGALRTYAYDSGAYAATPTGTIAQFPTGDGHYTRTLLEYPDDQLLVSIGSSCNVCEEGDPRRATVQALDPATGAMTPFATGLRNTVFMALNPVDGSVWGTDNGRDLIGDDIPPDEVNVIRQGGNYGWPICYGKNVHDTDFDSKQYIQDPCASAVPSTIDLPAHAAALGLAFIPEEGWPEAYRHDLLVAYHGSWNRSKPSGYEVVRIELDENARYAGGASVPFLTGFMPEGGRGADDALGRPAGVLAEPGGIVYVSDDHAGAIYRITYDGE